MAPSTLIRAPLRASAVTASARIRSERSCNSSATVARARPLSKPPRPAMDVARTRKSLSRRASVRYCRASRTCLAAMAAIAAARTRGSPSEAQVHGLLGQHAMVPRRPGGQGFDADLHRRALQRDGQPRIVGRIDVPGQCADQLGVYVGLIRRGAAGREIAALIGQPAEALDDIRATADGQGLDRRAAGGHPQGGRASGGG